MSNSIDKLTPTVFLDRKLIVYLLNEKKTIHHILPRGIDQSGRPDSHRVAAAQEGKVVRAWNRLPISCLGSPSVTSQY